MMIMRHTFFDPDMDHQVRAAVMEEFRKALTHLPKWAVAKGFDEWTRTMTRRPSPADIGILAGRAMAPLANELAYRARLQVTAVHEPRSDDEKERAEKVLHSAGFTPKRIEAVKRNPMALTVDDFLYTERQGKLHWTETVARDSPEMQALRKARLANPLMAAGMRGPAPDEVVDETAGPEWMDEPGFHDRG
jgi:hypothetical protein